MNDDDWLDYVGSDSDEPGWADRRVPGHLEATRAARPDLYPATRSSTDQDQHETPAGG